VEEYIKMNIKEIGCGVEEWLRTGSSGGFL
jgi:hypothetical protein